MQGPDQDGSSPWRCWQVWESYTGEPEQANGSSHAEEGPLQAETTTVSVTDVNDATLFYFQVRLGAVLTQMP